jgi:hypothetical protein
MNPQNSPIPPAVPGTAGSGGSATQTGGTFSETKNKITQTARDAASKVKTAAASTAAKAKDEAGRLVSEKKEQAAERVGGYSSALHESAQAFEEQDPNIAWFTHRAADKLQNVAEYMRSCNYSGLRTDCEGFARRHPAAFFGGMFFAGLMIGNVMKASQRKLTQPEDDRRYNFEDPETMGQTGVGESFNPQNQLSETERTSAGL